MSPTRHQDPRKLAAIMFTDIAGFTALSSHDEEKALELDPEYAGTINLLAYTYADLHDYEKAIKYLQHYVQLVPGEANPYDTMGDIYTYYLGNLEEGIINYEYALKIKPNFSSKVKLSLICALQEQYDQAVKWLEYSIDHTEYPNFKLVLYIWKGSYFYNLGRVKAAERELNRAEKQGTKLGIKIPQTLVELTRGWGFYDQGQFNLAREKFKA